MNAIDATGPYRRPCGTNEIRPAVILQPSSPRPRSRAPRQSTPRTVADAPATLQGGALAIAACPAVPDPNVADPPSHHLPSRCCDNQLNPPNMRRCQAPSWGGLIDSWCSTPSRQEVHSFDKSRESGTGGTQRRAEYGRVGPPSWVFFLFHII